MKFTLYAKADDDGVDFAVEPITGVNPKKWYEEPEDYMHWIGWFCISMFCYYTMIPEATVYSWKDWTPLEIEIKQDPKKDCDFIDYHYFSEYTRFEVLERYIKDFPKNMAFYVARITNV